MKPGTLLKIIIGPTRSIGAWSIENAFKKIGNMCNGDVVIYLKNTNEELQYIDVISKYGICSISEKYTTNEIW
jgi:hypothetical protein